MESNVNGKPIKECADDELNRFIFWHMFAQSMAEIELRDERKGIKKPRFPPAWQSNSLSDEPEIDFTKDIEGIPSKYYKFKQECKARNNFDEGAAMRMAMAKINKERENVRRSKTS